MTLPPLYRWALRSKVVFLAFGAGLLFLFCQGSSEFGNDAALARGEDVTTWENWRTHKTGYPAWYEDKERTWGEERHEADGSVKRATLGVESGGRVIWTSLAWLYPLSFAVVFWVREVWLFRRARRASSE